MAYKPMHGVRFSPRFPRRAFLNNVELWLSSLGSALIGGTLMLLHPVFAEPWETVAATACAVVVLQGIMFWSIRQRQRAVRNQAIHEVTRMLQDRINNELAVILMNISLSSRKPDADLGMLRSTQERVQRISQHVRTLSEESLEAWKARYDTTGLPGR